MGERSRMPARAEVENWLQQLTVDLEWFYDAEIGKSGPYRWARSGLDKVRSHQTGLRRGVRPAVYVEEDGEKLSVSVTQVEAAAMSSSINRVKRAAWYVNDAMRCLSRARQQLTLVDKRPLDDSPTLPGWVRKDELEQLKANQRKRQARGVGFGDE